MKRTLLVLGCLTFAMVSCQSPEERAASKTTTPTEETAPAAADSTPAPATADTTAKTTAPAPAPATTTPAAPAPAPAAKAPAAPAKKMKGEGLLAKADCLACHNLTQKLVGPAYVNVAAKYPATEENIEHLAEKVIAGGQGVWGAIPMTPHPTLSKDDAKEMVKYILSLKK